MEINKALFGYCGGKSRLSQQIIKYMADHKVYIEPFFGSGGIYFCKGFKSTKQNDYIEVINDLNADIVNFFEQLRDNHQELIEKLEYYEYSETLRKKSKTNCDFYKNSSNIDRACLFFFNICSSFGGDLNKGFAYGFNNIPLKVINKVKKIKYYSERIRKSYIFNRTYDVMIDKFDSKDSLFYLDPPYLNTIKYEVQKDNDLDYNKLSENIKNIKGKFILSHYKDEWIMDNFNNKDYKIIDLDHYCSINKSNGEERVGKDVDECIVLNYDYKDVRIWDGIERDKNFKYKAVNLLDM